MDTSVTKSSPRFSQRKRASLHYCLLIILLFGIFQVFVLFWKTEIALKECCSHSSSSEVLTLTQKALQNVEGKNNFSWIIPEKYSKSFSSVQLLDPSAFRLHVKVLTYDRVDSLQRCLRSLENAVYEGDKVNIDVFVDHVFDPKGRWTEKTEERTKQTHELLSKLDHVNWTHGEKRVHYRSRNSGIQPQWLEAWWPESVNDFAFIVEDDMEVSPLFYIYFKQMILHFYYEKKNFDPLVYGVSFQRQSFVPGIKGHPFRPHDQPYLYQLVGTWGQFLFPIPWREFRIWYDLRRYNESRDPGLIGLKTTEWWKRKGNKIWTPWIIKWAHSNNFYNLYPSFPGNLSLSVSHREVGSNFKINRKADASLIPANFLKEMEKITSTWPSNQEIERYDLCNRLVQKYKPATSLEDLNALLSVVSKKGNIALIIIPPGGYSFARNWLCHIEGIKNLKNYMFLIGDKEEGLDISQRGHPVYVLPGDEISKEVEPTNWKEVWRMVHFKIVQEVLSLGYHVLLSNVDKIWLKNPFDVLDKGSFDVKGHLSADSFSESVLYMKSTLVTLDIWRKALQSSKGRPKGDEVARVLVNGVNFVELSNSTLESSLFPHVSLLDGSLEEKKYKMAQAGLWVIDDYDLACRAVTCVKNVNP